EGAAGLAPCGARALAYGGRKSAHGPRARQPRLGLALRPGPRRNAQRPWHAGRTAHAPGTARLAGPRFPGARMGFETSPSAHLAPQDISNAECRRRTGPAGRSDEPPSVALSATPPGRGEPS